MTGHNIDGSTNFANLAGAEIYEQQLHGPDGALLLDPFLRSALGGLASTGIKEVLDIGSGAGPWSAAMQRLGIGVVALENGQAMMERAVAGNLSDILRSKGADPGVAPVLADGLRMPFPNGSFDAAVSINVGCNMRDLDAHFEEMARVLSPGGAGVITAPINLHRLYFRGSHGPALRSRIGYWIDDEPKLGEIKVPSDWLGDQIATISEHVLRATILLDESGLPQKVMSFADVNGGAVDDGEPIWRIIPGGLAVPNYYHTVESYDGALERNGFDIVKKLTPTLVDVTTSIDDEFCDAYWQSAPFAIYSVRKR